MRRNRRRATTEVGWVKTWLLDQGVPSVVQYAAGRRTIARVTPGLVLIFVLGFFGLGGRLITGNLQAPVWRAILDTRISDAQAAVAAGVVILGLVVGNAAAVWISRFRDRSATLVALSRPGRHPGRRLPRSDAARRHVRGLPAARGHRPLAQRLPV